MKTEQQDEHIPGAALSPGGETLAGSFRSVLRHRAFVLLWVAQLLLQIVFNAANYGVTTIVTAVTHSAVLVNGAIVPTSSPERCACVTPLRLRVTISADSYWTN